jgi:hypothetical protein
MISTVTTSTITTVTNAAIAGSLALIGVLVLLVLLIKKELASASEESRFKKLCQGLNIGIVPFLIAFFIIVVSRVIQVLH